MAVILMYHAISPRPETSRGARFCCAPQRFRSHLQLLRAAGWQVLPLDDLVALVRARRPLPTRAAAITLDDGFRDAVEHALPLLREAGVPATAFVATDCIGRANEWMVREGYDARPMLSPDEIVRLHRSGVAIGAHSASHPRLSLLSRDDAEREMRSSRDVLERLLGAPVRHFAYPYGDVSPRERELARLVGFTSACGVVPGPIDPNGDPYDLPRLEVCGWDGPVRFLGKVLRASLRGTRRVRPHGVG
ncbi:polysaccharide deacetylase family protein [Candidatus Binatia bacterium]|nr:polysaccharide deacetylase family protein [Candidatus Binatia bacterium]